MPDSGAGKLKLLVPFFHQSVIL